MGPLPRCPVLVVPQADHGVRAPQHPGIPVDVDTRAVGERDAQALGQHHQRPLVHQELPVSVAVVGAVEAHREGAGGVRPGGTGVQAAAAPAVVRLPGRRSVQQDGTARAVGGADDQRDVPLVAGVRLQPKQIGALRPAGGVHGQRPRPVGPHGAGRGQQVRGRPDAAGYALRRPDPAGLPAAVPADPESGDAKGRGGRRHVQPEGLARSHAHPVRVAGHGVRRPGGRQTPGGGARRVPLRLGPQPPRVPAGRVVRVRRGGRARGGRAEAQAGAQGEETPAAEAVRRRGVVSRSHMTSRMRVRSSVPRPARSPQPRRREGARRRGTRGGSVRPNG